MPICSEIASRGRALADNCKALIEKANANGGTDNITVILAEFSGAGTSSPWTPGPPSSAKNSTKKILNRKHRKSSVVQDCQLSVVTE